MNFKRIELMIKNNLGAVTNAYKAKNPLKKKKREYIIIWDNISIFYICRIYGIVKFN